MTSLIRKSGGVSGRKLRTLSKTNAEMVKKKMENLDSQSETMFSIQFLQCMQGMMRKKSSQNLMASMIDTLRKSNSTFLSFALTFFISMNRYKREVSFILLRLKVPSITPFLKNFSLIKHRSQ
jgi:hypothetical protein